MERNDARRRIDPSRDCLSYNSSILLDDAAAAGAAVVFRFYLYAPFSLVFISLSLSL